MAENRVDAQLADADRDAALAAIATVREKLPFLLDLSPEERQGMPKMGDKSRAFVSKALEIATQNPDFLPRSFDLEAFRRDVALYDALRPVALAMTQAQELLDDTLVAAGSEAYAAALVVYQYAKGGAGSALDEVVDDLGRRFARKSRGAGPVSNSGS